MKRALIGMALLLITVLPSLSQTKNITVTGRVIENDTKEPVVQATIQLLSLPDSTFVTGIATNQQGNFTLPKVAKGKYLLKVSYIGFNPYEQSFQLAADRNIGTVALHSDAITLQGAVVTAEAPQVQVVEDSLVFNASAYRTPEGAMLEELVKKLPGAELDDDGNVTINGKAVSKLLVEGKEFFAGDVKTGLKNLPVEMVEKLKSYERKSDLARVTGIDDGEEETVLDLSIKKDMKHGWTGNLDAALGTQHRYLTSATINRMSIGAEPTQMTLIGSANNLNNRRFSGGGGGRFGGTSGLSAPRELGFNFALERKKVDMGGSVRYNHGNTDTRSINSSQRIQLVENEYKNVFGNSNSGQWGRNDNFNANFRIEWRPDTMTNIIFRPNLSYGNNRNGTSSYNAEFNEDPLDVVDNPNDYLNIDDFENMGGLTAIAKNAQNRFTRSKSNSLSVDGRLQVNRKLNNRGRNITFVAEYGYSNSDGQSRSQDETRFYQVPDSVRYTNRYVLTPTHNYDYELQVTYSEPIGQSTYLQFRYEFEPSISKSDRKTYTQANEWKIDDPVTANSSTLDADLSKYAKYTRYDHNAEVSLRFIREKFRLSAGIQFRPQHTTLDYRYQGLDTTVVRNVYNFAPNIDFRYRFSKVTQLRFNYRGRPGQPSMEDMLPVTDDSNSSNIKVGNPGLKPSFTHSANLFFNTYNADAQRGIFASAFFTATQNSISNSTQYNSITGDRITTPKNINGNWNVNGRFGFNTALKNKKYTINSQTGFQYTNSVSYLADSETKTESINTSTNLRLNENIRGAYRNDWFEFGITGSISYNFERNELRPESNQQPYNFSYGASTTIYTPWKMNINTNIENQSRRGYSDANMNRDELVWNAQVAQTLFKGAATLSLELYDILHQRSSISRSFSSESRSITQYNSINSYCMVHFIYRLNIFGSKEVRQRMQQMQQQQGGGGRGPGGWGGGGSGGRPPRGGGRPF
ncbi:MAG: TonB-dependent receptor [Prevotellaceae bacterium]|jgi:hypothetical protein|nr:TonB-dependent receptor [Prevotellaceae bacterium]